MKHLIILFISTTLIGCAGMGSGNLAQAMHGDRVKKESDSTLCLKYLSGNSISLSNQVREDEIRNRNLNCASIISPRDVEIERRLRRAEATAKDAEERARRAERASENARQKTQRQEWCARGLKAFCS